MSSVRKRVRYTGRVQGVGFRATARHIADGFVVTGWVRNEADGGVMLEVQGDAAEVGRFLTALREAMDRNIKTETAADAPLDAATDEHGFEIRR